MHYPYGINMHSHLVICNSYLFKVKCTHLYTSKKILDVHINMPSIAGPYILYKEYVIYFYNLYTCDSDVSF